MTIDDDITETRAPRPPSFGLAVSRFFVANDPTARPWRSSYTKTRPNRSPFGLVGRPAERWAPEGVDAYSASAAAGITTSADASASASAPKSSAPR